MLHFIKMISLIHFSVHINTVHKADLVFPCSFCDSRFGSNGNLTRHIEACHGSKIWKCDVCKDVFNAEAYLKKHKRIKHPIKKTSKHVTPKFIKD